MIRLGSFFSGIGGLDLGLERSMPNAHTVWQIEKDPFCQRVLRKHWPNAKLYGDVRDVQGSELEVVDVAHGGFPCQDLSYSGKRGGIYEKKSGLYWDMWRVICELRERPKVLVLENVPGLLSLGMSEVLGSLAEIGYDAEWTVLSAAQIGAPHKRNRVWIVAYSCGEQPRKEEPIQTGGVSVDVSSDGKISSDSHSFRAQIQIEGEQSAEQLSGSKSPPRGSGQNYWAQNKAPYPICSVDDGISDRVARLRALGNSIVPQCSEWIGRRIMEAGLLC